MTTEPVPTQTRTRLDGTTQTAFTHDEMTRLLRRMHRDESAKQMFVKARGGTGTDTVGLYLELVCTAPGRESHARYFVVGEHVYVSLREKGMSKANWRHKAGSSLASALGFIEGQMNRADVHLFGRILLVELEADSISQVESGQLPSARFRGVYRIERDFGKYDWSDEVIASQDIPDAARALLAH